MGIFRLHLETRAYKQEVWLGSPIFDWSLYCSVLKKAYLVLRNAQNGVNEFSMDTTNPLNLMTVGLREK